MDEAGRNHVMITRNGRDTSVLMSAAEHRSLLATMEVLSDPEAMAGLAASEADVRAGRVYDWEDVKRDDLARRARRRNTAVRG